MRCVLPLRARRASWILLSGILSRRKEDRNVAAHRNIDPHRFRATVLGEVLRQPFAQLPRITANNVVFERAVIERPVKDLHADLMFSDFVAASFQRLRHHEQQELRQQRGTGEVRSGNNALGQFPIGSSCSVGRAPLPENIASASIGLRQHVPLKLISRQESGWTNFSIARLCRKACFEA